MPFRLPKNVLRNVVGPVLAEGRDATIQRVGLIFPNANQHVSPLPLLKSGILCLDGSERDRPAGPHSQLVLLTNRVARRGQRPERVDVVCATALETDPNPAVVVTPRSALRRRPEAKTGTSSDIATRLRPRQRHVDHTGFLVRIAIAVIRIIRTTKARIHDWRFSALRPMYCADNRPSRSELLLRQIIWKP